MRGEGMAVFRESESAYAKINMFLRICGLRQDGYHLLSSLMQTISLCDTVTVSCSDSARADGFEPGISLTASTGTIPADSRNTAYKAARIFLDALGCQDIAVRIHIEKKIPSQAGMGGGSSDAAAVLRIMSHSFPGVMSQTELVTAAASIGADVPFCLAGGTQLCEGIGEILTPVRSLKGLPILLIKPSCSISTPWAFSEYDKDPVVYGNMPERDTAIQRFIDAREGSDPLRRVREAAPFLYNDLEGVADRKYPELSEIRAFLMREGAVLARMSGSGSTVFGVFGDSDSCAAALAKAETEYRDGYFIFPAETV